MLRSERDSACVVNAMVKRFSQIRTEAVCGEHDAVLELESEDRSSCHDRLSAGRGRSVVRGWSSTLCSAQVVRIMSVEGGTDWVRWTPSAKASWAGRGRWEPWMGKVA